MWYLCFKEDFPKENKNQYLLGECVLFALAVVPYIVKERKNIINWKLLTGINSDNNDLFYSIQSFCRLNPKGNCFLDVGVKAFRRGTDNLPSFPAAMPSPFSLTGSNDRIWHNRQLSLKQRWKKKAFYYPSVFLPNPFLLAFSHFLISYLYHFLLLSTLDENSCHEVKACNVEIHLQYNYRK